MKKVIALVLAVVMVLSLCACGSSVDAAKVDEILATLKTMQATLNQLVDDNETAEEAPEAEEAVEAEESGDKIVVDFQWNGQKEVWSVLPTTGAEGLVMINDAMGAVMEAEGFTYVKKDAQGDPTAQVQFVEDAIAAGNVGALMVAAMDVDLLQDVIIQALEAGIAVAYLGAEPTAYGISGCVYTAYEITGMYAVEAAEDWALNSGANIPTTEDGKYEIAADTYYNIADGVYRSRAILGTIEKSDNLTLVAETSSYGDNAYTDAYNNATDVLGAHPDCHLFIAYEPEEAMGAADAIANYCEVNGLSVADYCVIPCYAEDTTFTTLYEASAEDASANAIKGYATYGDPAEERDGETIIPPVLTGEHLADILLSACGIDGYDFTYGETYYDTITAVNTIGFEQVWHMGDENPAAEYKY
jgi:ABC-type sugar transport system substrate-binding protein